MPETNHERTLSVRYVFRNQLIWMVAMGVFNGLSRNQQQHIFGSAATRSRVATVAGGRRVSNHFGHHLFPAIHVGNLKIVKPDGGITRAARAD
jgi:hypothetical protein